MTEQLKPCPFCGSQPIVETPDLSNEGGGWTRIFCVNMRCSTTVDLINSDERDHLAKAINAWNTRAPIENEGTST